MIDPFDPEQRDIPDLGMLDLPRPGTDPPSTHAIVEGVFPRFVAAAEPKDNSLPSMSEEKPESHVVTQE